MGMPPILFDNRLLGTETEVEKKNVYSYQKSISINGLHDAE